MHCQHKEKGTGREWERGRERQHSGGPVFENIYKKQWSAAHDERKELNGERSQQGLSPDMVITVCEYIETEIRRPTAEKQHILGERGSKEWERCSGLAKRLPKSPNYEQEYHNSNIQLTNQINKRTLAKHMSSKAKPCSDYAMLAGCAQVLCYQSLGGKVVRWRAAPAPLMPALEPGWTEFDDLEHQDHHPPPHLQTIERKPKHRWFLRQMKFVQCVKPVCFQETCKQEEGKSEMS